MGIAGSAADIVKNGKIQCSVSLRGDFGASAPMPEPIAMVNQLIGNVSITNPNKPNQSILATEGMCLYEGDSVLTGNDSAVGLKYPDGALMALGADSNYTVEAQEENASTRNRIDNRDSLSVRSGRIADADRDLTRVQTPATILGVRG